MKGNVIRLNIMHLNSVHLNSIGEVQSVSLKAGESTEDPVYPPTTYTLAANVSNGKVSATKNGTAISLPYVAIEGDVIVLSVTPDEGYEFNGWLDGNKSNPRTVTMTGNVVLSASCVEIAKPTYTLSAAVTNGMVSATRNGSAVNLPFTANEGDTIVLSVTPNEGYEFNGWADGNTDNPRSITMTADVVLSAQCVEVVVPPSKEYIQFEDAEVERVLMSKGVSSDGVGITMEDAEKVTSIGAWFMSNKTITSFEEFEYFTGVSQLAMNAFNGCVNLKKLTLPKSCVSLQQQSLIDTGLEKINLENVAYIGRYAIARTNISEISAPNAETIEVGYLFKCPNLKEVNAEDFGNITILDGGTGNFPTSTFYECASLEKVVFPKTLTKLSGWMLGECRNLKYVEIPDVVTFDCQYFAFVAAGATGTSHLDVVIRATIPFANDNTFLMRRTDFTIYVPDASLEAYKTAVNWSAYADRIHPLSEIEGVVIEDGYELNSNGTLKESANYFVVGFIDINGGESITWGMSSGAIGYLVEYDESGNYKDYWRGNSTNKRTITTKSSTKKIKACFRLDQKDSAYILDNTNGKYLWKGANVE